MEQCEGVAHAGHGHLVAATQTPANIIASSEEMRDGLPVLIAYLELTIAAHAGRSAEEETRRLGRAERRLEHGVHELGILAPILVDALLAQLVVTVNRGGEHGRIYVDETCQLLDGVGIVVLALTLDDLIPCLQRHTRL